MGISFHIMALRPGIEGLYPLDSLDESTVEMDIGQDRLDQHLSEFPGISRNGTLGWLWDVPEGGSLDLSVNPLGAYIDTHARWPAVLEIYLYVRNAFPRAILLDPQNGLGHDERSFRDFLASPPRCWPEPKPEEYSEDRLNAMVEALAQNDRDTAFGLFRLGSKAEPVVPALISLLDHPQNEVRRNAITILGAIGPAAAMAAHPLAAIIEDPTEEPLRVEIFRALGRIGVSKPDAVAALIDTVWNGAVWKRHSALEALLRLQEDRLALPLLFEQMAQADICPPSSWATSFAELFYEVNDLDGATQGLFPLFGQPDGTRRLVAAIAMDALARRHACCGESLAVRALRDRWERVRRIAVTTLARLPRTQEVVAHLEVCRRDADYEVKARADWALAYGVVHHDPQRG